MILRYMYINIKRYLKNPTIFLMVVAMPIVAVAFMNLMLNNTPETKILAMDNDKTEVSGVFLEELDKKYNVDIVTEGEFKDPEFDAGSASILMTVNKGYEDKVEEGVLPSIQVKELSNSDNNKFLAMEIDNIVKSQVQNKSFEDYEGEYLRTELIQEDSLSVGLVIGLVIAYYVFIGSTAITNDMLEMKNNNILKRAISTANKNNTIMIGIFAGSFIFLALSGVISFIGSKELSSFLDDIPMINGIISMILTAMISISWTIFFVRWFKNKNIISSVGTFVSFGLFALGIFAIQAPYISENFAKFEILGYISPYYWVGKILMGSVVEGSIVLLLMAVATFTCGTYKLREFATN